MITHCSICGRSLQGLRVLTYENVVLSSDGARMIAGSELSESTWRVFCSNGHEVGAGEVISLDERKAAEEQSEELYEEEVEPNAVGGLS
ncbi:MAG: hypothetical protein ABR579_00715 [Actinomycetota bacterium]